MRYCVRAYKRKHDGYIIYGIWDSKRKAFLGGAATSHQADTKSDCDRYNSGLWEVGTPWLYEVVDGVEIQI